MLIISAYTSSEINWQWATVKKTTTL